MFVSLARLCPCIRIVNEVASFPVGLGQLTGVARKRTRYRPVRKLQKGRKTANNCCI